MVEREGDDLGPTELEVEFGSINEQNVEQLRVLNTSCFPVNYNDNFYKDVVAQKSDELSKFAYVNGFVVGAVCTRVEPLNNRDDGNKPTGRHRIYIMTLGVLAAYRCRGVGGKLIQSVLDFWESNKDGAGVGGGGAATAGSGGSSSAGGDENDGDRGNNGKGGGGPSSASASSSSSSSPSAFAKSMQTVDEITLHVQTNNDDAMNFYINRFGFERGEMVENYYKRIDPPHCYVLFKKLR